MGLLSRNRGIRFERAVARRLRAIGIPVERTDETYRGYGYDLVEPKFGLAVQTKATKRKADLVRAWGQVVKAPYRIRAAVHAYHQGFRVQHRAIWAVEPTKHRHIGTLNDFLEWLSGLGQPT